MKLIVGLGNPGKKYENSRHNVGYRMVETLFDSKLPKDIVAKKTNVFMNESGRAVKRLVESGEWKVDDLYIVHDDLDIPLGQFKIQKGKGPKVHNGVNSVEEALGANDFWRVRVGVDNRDPNNRTPGDEYVLQDFTEEEKVIVDKVMKEVINKLKA